MLLKTARAFTSRRNLTDVAASPAVTTESSNPDKLALFKGLFRGREDVYAVRWTNPDGRAGYSTAALSRSHRERGDYLQLTDAVLRSHLDGHRTVGVYPLLQDDTCWFLAADFDKSQWQDDAAAYLAACEILGVPAAMERSRSGNGGHVSLAAACKVGIGNRI